MSDLRFAVMGTGFWSHYQIPAWFEAGGVKLVAVYNRTVSKAEKVAKKFGIPRVYGDPEELLQKEKLDFVDIITEVPAHAPLVYLAAKYRVPVICQKPMAPDYETAQKMVAACQEAGIPFFVHENFRWQRPLRALKAILDEAPIGQPVRARIQFVHGMEDFVWENQPMLKTLKRFALMDLGSHLLDLARFYFGEPQSLYCAHFQIRDDIAGEDAASVMLKIGDMLCLCEISYSTRTEWGHFPETFVYVEGKQGTIELGPNFWIRVTTEAGTHARRYPPPRYAWCDPDYNVAHASMVPIHQDFLRAFKTGQPAETSGEDNLKTMRLVEAAYESASRNQVITLD
ncbi:MAG: Gfo/Idh/MocA family oxidoreductase [Anaerolineae bacterium]